MYIAKYGMAHGRTHVLGCSLTSGFIVQEILPYPLYIGQP